MKLQFTRSPENFSRRQIALVAVVLSVLVGAAGYFTMLTGFAPYDDEGSLMLSVKQYLGGMRIYEDVFSVYGPLYYFYNWLIRIITFTPVNHDITRMSSIFPWIACSLLSGWVTLRLTRSIVFGALSVTISSMTVVFFKSEPGHPQELALLILIMLAALPLWADIEQRRPLLMLALGVLVGALLLIKVNIGIYMLGAAAMAIVSECPDSRAYRCLAFALGAGCIFLPSAVMWNHLDAGWARVYCFHASITIAIVVFAILRVRRRRILTIRDAGVAVAGLALVVAAVIGVLTAQRVSVHTVLDSLLYLPSRVFAQNRNWFISPKFSPLWIIWALGGLVGAFLLLRKQPDARPEEQRRLFLFKTAFSALALITIPLRPDMLPLAGAFVWLVLFPPWLYETDGQLFPRILLCIISAMQTLYAYPVYGSQGQFIQYLLLTVVVVCAADSLEWLTAFGTKPVWLAHRGRTLATAALVLMAIFNLGIAWNRYRNYRALPALDLPGAGRVHVEPEVKEQFEQLARDLGRSCDVFEALPGLPSFNFWSRKDPLTGLNSDAWTIYLSAGQQARIVTALSSHPRACIIYHPVLTAFWNKGNEDLSSLPLVAYIRENFRPLASAGKYQLLVRR
jgi:hypothetical protein